MKTRNYSATIVIDPSGSEGSSNEMIPKLTEAIAQSDGEVNKVVELGQHDFAYPIKRILPKGHTCNSRSLEVLTHQVKLKKNCGWRKRLIAY